MDDIEKALALLKQETELTDEEASELLTELECADIKPRASRVLFPTEESITLELDYSGDGRLFIVTKRVYVHSFLFLVRETRSGNRRILFWAPLR